MVAGRGITHSERFERARRQGDQLHGIQAWVPLPKADEETEPSFNHHEGDDLPVWQDGGVRGRLIAGDAFGLSAKVRTHSPLFYAHLDMDPGATTAVPRQTERALYVAAGAVEMEGQRCAAGEMAVIGPGPDKLSALVPSIVMLLGGEPLGERFLFWNFVSSSKERLEQAKADWVRRPDEAA